MPVTCPFPVSGAEFKGKRVLMTGGTKGMGELWCVALPWAVLSRNDHTFASTGWSDGCSLRAVLYRHGDGRERCTCVATQWSRVAERRSPPPRRLVISRLGRAGRRVVCRRRWEMAR